MTATAAEAAEVTVMATIVPLRRCHLLLGLGTLIGARAGMRGRGGRLWLRRGHTIVTMAGPDLDLDLHTEGGHPMRGMTVWGVAELLGTGGTQSTGGMAGGTRGGTRGGMRGEMTGGMTGRKRGGIIVMGVPPGGPLMIPRALRRTLAVNWAVVGMASTTAPRPQSTSSAPLTRASVQLRPVRGLRKRPG